MARKPCPLCKGKKKLPAKFPCPECKGYDLVRDENGSFIPCRFTECVNGVVECLVTCPDCNGRGTIPA